MYTGHRVKIARHMRASSLGHVARFSCGSEATDFAVNLESGFMLHALSNLGVSVYTKTKAEKQEKLETGIVTNSIEPFS